VQKERQNEVANVREEPLNEGQQVMIKEDDALLINWNQDSGDRIQFCEELKTVTLF